jgi:hypothetical protein
MLMIESQGAMSLLSGETGILYNTHESLRVAYKHQDFMPTACLFLPES